MVLCPSFPKSIPTPSLDIPQPTPSCPPSLRAQQRNYPLQQPHFIPLVRALSWKAAGHQLERLISSQPSVLTSLKLTDGLDRVQVPLSVLSFSLCWQPPPAGTWNKELGAAKPERTSILAGSVGITQEIQQQRCHSPVSREGLHRVDPTRGGPSVVGRGFWLPKKCKQQNF